MLAALVAVLARPAGAADPQSLRAFVVSEATISGWLRIGGKPGDLALRNRLVTAIVRKRDGWLVDFFPNDGGSSTAPQLKGMSNVDGLWLMHPLLKDGRIAINLSAREVRIAKDSIEAHSDVALGAGTLRVVTSYRLDADRPRLVITSRFEHTGGGRVAHLSLGDSIKWGNVDYFVDGHGRTPWRFSAQGRWIGRKGAGGDLVLRTLEQTPMRIHYEGQHHGLAPGIVTVYAAGALASRDTWLVQRALAYEAVPERPAAEPPTGVLDLQVRDESNRALAAKLTLRGVEGTPDPAFGNDGDETGAGRFVWSGTGKFTRRLPVGSYRVLATAGIERDAASFSVRIAEGKTTELSGKLPRVVKTPGWISADLHLHQLASIDADIACSTRVISVAAEGVEFALASDHFTVSDLGPAVAALTAAGKLASRVVTMSGSEVSTVGNRFGHFNLYPMKAGDEVGYEDTTPKRLFAEMRRVSPEGVIQVNHPRWQELGYFNRYKLDPTTARVAAQFRNEYDPSFDAIEIFNGVDAASEPKIRQVLFDWLHLLGQGHRYTATGNSDSHKLFYVDPGLPRNMIAWGKASDDAQDLDATPEAVVKAIRQGRVVVTSGPILDVDIDGTGPGQTVRGRGSRLALRIRVRAAPWIDVSEVEVLLGAQGRRVRWLPVKKTSDVDRLDTTIELVAPGKTFVVVVAKGKRDLPNVFSPKVRPYAFTNPIWIEP